MASRKKAILVSPDEDQLLRHLYLAYRIPDGQYNRRDDELRQFTNTWNDLANRQDLPGDVLHYIVTQRKQKQKNWPRFNGTHKRLDAMPDDFLSTNEWAILEAVYLELVVPREIGSDSLQYDETLTAQVAREFYQQAKRAVSGRLLFAAIMARRKRGECNWIKVGAQGSGGKGFRDIGAV
jgi:hypothetical protein